MLFNFGRSKKKHERFTPEDYRYHWNLETEIFKQCFDDRTRVFNWSTWFARKDEIIHTAPAEVLEDIDSTFRWVGSCQILYIDAIIENQILQDPYNPILCIQRLKREIVDTEILVNLTSMYSCVNGTFDHSNCPEPVQIYERKLSEIIYRKDNVEKSEFNEIVKLGRQITDNLII